ncbi:MAG: hypothetical protein ACI9QN_002513 [Arcticibacterium sp.]|jgi:hypothetical protein
MTKQSLFIFNSSMKRFLLLISVFSLVLILISYPLSYFLDREYSLDKKQNWILSLKEKKYDYAVLGSSRVYNVFDINTFSACSNSYGVNIGSSGSSYAESFLLLREFLKWNTIDTLYLNVDEFSFNSDISYSDPFKEYMFLPMFSDEMVQEIYADYLPPWKLTLWRWLPLTKYIEFNSEIKFESHSNNSWSNTGGTLLVEGKMDNTIDGNKEVKQYNIDSRDEKYFRAILELSRNKEIKVILIKTPIFDGFFKNVQGTEEIDKYVIAVANERSLQFFNYQEFFDSSNRSYFKDVSHTNNLGSISYTRLLCESIFYSNN